MQAEPNVHRIDADDRFTFVNDGWLDFARENGSDLSFAAVADRPLWQFITGGETAHLYRLILQRVRENGVGVSVPFRCDAPAVRRSMVLEVEPLAGGAVEFRSRLSAEEPRSTVALLDASARRGSWFLAICSWCKKARLAEGEWVEIEVAASRLRLFDKPSLPQVTHGVCDACVAEIRRRLRG